MQNNKASVGRIVHYVRKGVCHAAIVTAMVDISSAEEGSVTALCVLDTDSMTFKSQVHYAARKQADTWHWPERA